MREEDVPAVVALAARVPTAPHWPPFEFTRVVRVVQENPQRRGAWVAWSDAAGVLGFAMAAHVAGTAELEAVVTAPEHRRQGVGRALVEGVIGWARAMYAERVVLEARASNLNALALYRRLGFREDGLRPRYYRNPEEDAVLMSFSLRGEPAVSPGSRA